MTAGDVVWLVLAVLAAGWLVVTVVAGPLRLPGPVDMARWVVRSWGGRLLVLAAWATAGWHLFCQRP